VSPITSESRSGPGPAQLPGIEGFYVLRAGRELGRYQTDGRFQAEPELTNALSEHIDALMRRYRSGDLEEAAIGLVTMDVADRPWRSASLLFSEHALREIFKTNEDDKATLSSFQKRNRARSLFQGMEMVLSAREPSQPTYPRYCPVLYAPAGSGEDLSRRYGVGEVETGKVLEVLDLMAPFSQKDRRNPVFARMVTEMARTRIATEMRSSPEFLMAGAANPEIKRLSADEAATPWMDEGKPRSVDFQSGDPVPYWLLGTFAPFNQLNDLQRQFIARGLTLLKRPAGTVFVKRGSQEDISVCLVEGTIELETFDGRSVSVVGGTKRARIPISQLHPHAYTVQAATGVTVFLISQSMVRKVTRITTTYSNRPGIEVREGGLLPDSIGNRPQGGSARDEPRQ
jgi:hypothetical protein